MFEQFTGKVYREVTLYKLCNYEVYVDLYYYT